LKLNNKRLLFIRAFVPFFVWIAFMLVLLSMPASSFGHPMNFWKGIHIDKWVHAVLFMVLSILLARGIMHYFKKNARSVHYVILSIGVGILFGSATEIMQELFFNSRNGSFYDFLANVMGTFLGIIFICSIFGKNFEKAHTKSGKIFVL